MNAKVCEIYTDVDGVFTADPRIVPTARKMSSVSYEEMLEMAAYGAEGAGTCGAWSTPDVTSSPIHVRSSFTQREGTWIMDLPNGRCGFAWR